jgi:hypothetical protein
VFNVSNTRQLGREGDQPHCRGAQRKLPISIRLPGTISSSEVSQKPGRGKLKKINTSTYQYTAKARYKGTDTFAITATGKDEKTSGTSVISVEVTIK